MSNFIISDIILLHSKKEFVKPFVVSIADLTSYFSVCYKLIQNQWK